MAKRGRKPKGCVVEDLDSVLRRDIDLAIDSEAGESSRSIYNRFGLAQRAINIRTFRQYVSDRRKEHKGRQPATDFSSEDVPTLEELRIRCHIGILECLQSGDAKPYELASILARIQDADKISIQRDADKRLDDKHKAWLAKERKRIEQEKRAADTKLDAMAQEHGIPERVTEAVKLLYGIKF